jgi:phosphotransferase system  glucose/maltose/N-acetylglucosamine-specific IIC component
LLFAQAKMAFMIVDNLRGFFVSRPPLVVFMICLASFAIALITFAYVIKVKDIPNPDITEVRLF